MTLPTGPAVTFLFTDIEGSTRHEQAVGSAIWADVVAEHDRLLRTAIESTGGVVVKTEGDAFFAAFADPGSGVAAAVRAQRAVAGATWATGGSGGAAIERLRVRMGLHLGEGRLRERRDLDPEDYVGIDVNYAARIAAAANGGQIVLSEPLASVVADMIPAGETLRDEGLRIVKDFDEPRRLFRVVVAGAADDPRPLRTIEAPSNLPALPTELIGREAEIDVVSAALGDGRIVTLTGPGGSGKTRLAIGVADAIRGRFPDGTWFVDLASIRDPGLLEPTIAATIGLRESAERTASETLQAFVRDREVLLVLDNLEQILPRAAARVAELARGGPRARLLVTSRELLRVAGERGHLVPPLDLASAVALFEDRARLQRPELLLTDEEREAIRSICLRLEGLPLAIELAAARSRLFSPTALLERLERRIDLAGGARDLPERQRTLRSAIDWSHDLLSEADRRLFRRLSVFAGSWTPDVAVDVVEAGDLGIDPLEGLESLLDKSLVRLDAGAHPDEAGPRFSMHSLLREYASERLEEAAERSTFEARHAAAYLALAERLGQQLLGAGGGAALQSLDREQHDMRAAIDWSMATGEIRTGLRIAASTWRWYLQRGRLREDRAILGQLLERSSDLDDVRLRIAALAADGGLAYWMQDFESCRDRYDERLRLASQLGDPRLLADANYDIAFVHVVLDDPAGIRTHADVALHLYGDLGDAAALTRTRQVLVLVDFLQGEYARARDAEEEVLTEFRAQGSTFEVADSLVLLAAIYEELGDPASAWGRLTEGMSIFAEREMASGLARSLGMAALIQLRYGDRAFGARIAGTTRELGVRKSVMVAPAMVLHLPDPVVLAAELLGPERAAALLEDGAAEALPDVVAAVLASPTPDPTVARSDP